MNLTSRNLLQLAVAFLSQLCIQQDFNTGTPVLTPEKLTEKGQPKKKLAKQHSQFDLSH